MKGEKNVIEVLIDNHRLPKRRQDCRSRSELGRGGADEVLRRIEGPIHIAVRNPGPPVCDSPGLIRTIEPAGE